MKAEGFGYGCTRHEFLVPVAKPMRVNITENIARNRLAGLGGKGGDAQQDAKKQKELHELRGLPQVNGRCTGVIDERESDLQGRCCLSAVPATMAQQSPS